MIITMIIVPFIKYQNAQVKNSMAPLPSEILTREQQKKLSRMQFCGSSCMRYWEMCKKNTALAMLSKTYFSIHQAGMLTSINDQLVSRSSHGAAFMAPRKILQ